MNVQTQKCPEYLSIYIDDTLKKMKSQNIRYIPRQTHSGYWDRSTFYFDQEPEEIEKDY
jgi:hypothetical protein